MHKEFAAGAVIFRRENNAILFLLVYSRRNKIWGFPKGHIEPGESETEAAHREIREETGITNIHIIEGFRREDTYPAQSNRPPFEGKTIEKHSLYFLAETTERTVIIDGDEISAFRWADSETALSLLPFEGMKAILRDAAAAVAAFH